MGNCPNCGGTRYDGFPHYCTVMAISTRLPLATGEGATTRENVNWLLAECGRLRDQLALTEKQRRIFEELAKLNASERADKAEAERDRLREELKTTRKNLKRATYIAEHLWQMVDQETWRSTGGDDGQGHYEGDYHAEQICIEIQELSGEMNLREQET
jgi:hypothetical protein